jgi:hypothetical protein
MRRRTLHKLFFGAVATGFLALPIVVFFAPRDAAGTNEQMMTLPAYGKYRCALCHTAPTPNLDPTLNAFGNDFKDNGGWGPTLAVMNSDGDRCTNGFEIGDRDGDGFYDNPAAEQVENGNPGDPNDCTVSVDQSTWGIIKDLFRNEIRDLSEAEVLDPWAGMLASSP